MMDKVILLVEDDPNDELLTLRALKKGGILNEVVVVRDGQEALDYLFGPHLVPQVMLMDLKLPKISGLDVLKQVRQSSKTKFLPVVVLTSSKQDRDILESYHLGANSY